jgi:hypothetical protein
MPSSLLETARRLWRLIRRHQDVAAGSADDRKRSKARTLFWAEFQEGRREADARSARSR